MLKNKTRWPFFFLLSEDITSIANFHYNTQSDQLFIEHLEDCHLSHCESPLSQDPPAINPLILNLTIAFIMFGVALELKPEHFRNLALHPKAALVGAISQFLLMPFMTFLLALAFRNYITPTIGLGMILVASCPGGNVSNFFSALAKGNVALSVSLTAISDFGAILITPFNFAFWGTLFTKVYALLNASDLIRPLDIPFLHVLQTV